MSQLTKEQKQVVTKELLEHVTILNVRTKSRS